MAIETNHIQADEEPLTKLYGEDYLFKIPRFQRPISWSEGNFEELIDDIVAAFESQRDVHGSPVDGEGKPQDEVLQEYEPYFLGSIILNRERATDRYQIIDGQQRLTSLAILIGVIRDLMAEEWDVDSSWPSDLHEFIYEPGSRARGQDETVRLKPRSKEEDFFRSTVLTGGATLDVDKESMSDLSDPEQRIVSAIDVFQSYLTDWVENGGDPVELATFLTQRVLMVRISTSSLESAYRLFNVTNARGTPLNNADLLKSENLNAIDESERDEYADTWEEIELQVGNEELERLIGFMRHIILKEKNRSTIHEEFNDKVFADNPGFRGKEFIESLENVFGTYRDRIVAADLDADDTAKNVHYHNLVSLMRNVYPSDEWIIAIILFDRQFGGGDGLYEFVTKLERQLSARWLTGSTRNDRYSLVYELLEAIEEESDAETILSMEQLTSLSDGFEENFDDSLDLTNFYRKGNYQWPRYLLLRLDLARHDNTTVRREYGDSVTVEHILPQTSENDYWLDRFDDKEFRERWTNRLGNLVPLQGQKNYKASNKPFPKKYKDYFQKKSDLDITNDLEEYDHWTPNRLRQRHQDLKEEARELWIDT